ncbi:hypothetical protein [Micromonospora sp. NPDC004704]
MHEDDQEPSAFEQVTPAPREMTTDLPPVRESRQRARNGGRWPARSHLGPSETFAVGVSGRTRPDYTD